MAPPTQQASRCAFCVEFRESNDQQESEGANGIKECLRKA